MSNGIIGGFGIIMGAMVASIADMIFSTTFLFAIYSIYTAIEPMDSLGLGRSTLELIMIVLGFADVAGFLVFVCTFITAILMMFRAPFDMIGGRF